MILNEDGNNTPTVTSIRPGYLCGE